jgi:transcription initiation factor TFIIH subunit 4
MSNKLIEYTDLTSYIISLPKAIIEKIFDHPTTCLAIFRELPELSKVIVIRLLLLNQEVPQATVNSWINLKYQKESSDACQILSNLGIWQDVRTQVIPAWTLKPAFKKNLFLGIVNKYSPQEMLNIQTGGGDTEMDVGGAGVMIGDADSVKSSKQAIDAKLIEKLDSYSLERWESILRYIVNPRDAQNQICNSTKEILKFAGIMKSVKSDGQESDDGDSVTLTAKAFQFLLWNKRAQIWCLVLQLLDFCWQKNNQDISECLILLFELSFSTFGKSYSCEDYSPTKVEFLQELRKLGLVFMKTRKIKSFYPTRLAIQLANGLENGSELASDGNGYIVVETNYRIYAYTNSHLQISLIALFCDLLYKFPNMVVGSITRESIREAFKMGITAKQIVNFLCTNAHPQISSRKPIIPETIADQIHFWYNEKNRLQFTDGVFYGHFNSEEDYLMLKNYANDLDSLLWTNDNKRIMFVKKSSHDAIKKYWKQNKKN